MHQIPKKTYEHRNPECLSVILLCLPSEIFFQMFYFFTFFCNRQQREPPLGAKAFLNFLFEMESEFEAGHRLARSGL